MRRQNLTHETLTRRCQVFARFRRIIGTAAAWKAKGAEIEGARMTGKTNQNNSLTLPDAKANLNVALAELDLM